MAEIPDNVKRQISREVIRVFYEITPSLDYEEALRRLPDARRERENRNALRTELKAILASFEGIPDLADYLEGIRLAVGDEEYEQ